MAAAACRRPGKSGSSACVDNWLQSVRDVAHLYREQLLALPGDVERRDRLCELNVMVQARRVCRTTIVQQAWERGPQAHGARLGLQPEGRSCCATWVSAFPTSRAPSKAFARVAGLGTIGAAATVR